MTALQSVVPASSAAYEQRQLPCVSQKSYYHRHTTPRVPWCSSIEEEELTAEVAVTSPITGPVNTRTPVVQARRAP